MDPEWAFLFQSPVRTYGKASIRGGRLILRGYWAYRDYLQIENGCENFSSSGIQRVRRLTV